LSIIVSVLPHFPWSRFMFDVQEAIRRSRPARFTAQITESADEPRLRDSTVRYRSSRSAAL
jgi:hypothetical protein